MVIETLDRQPAFFVAVQANAICHDRGHFGKA
jgi:hypothetical protein